MQDRFSTSSEAVVAVDGVILTYDHVTYRAEGVAPGDCRDYFNSDTGYDMAKDAVRPDAEYMVYEAEIEFKDAVPELIARLGVSGEDTTLSFNCDGYEIRDVPARVHEVNHDSAVIGGYYDLGISG